MSRIILAEIVSRDRLNPPEWECKVCIHPGYHRTREVTPMMIHLLQIHNIRLSMQSFPTGILQSGTIFHVTADHDTDANYRDLFTSPLTVHQEK